MRFALPRGRWRYFMGGALAVIALLSQRVVSIVLAVFEDFGSEIPEGVRRTASLWWVGGWIALAVLSICAAGAPGQPRFAQAFVLASTTMLLLVVAAFIFTSALALGFSCGSCCGGGPIR